MEDEDPNAFIEWAAPKTKDSGEYPYYVKEEKKLVFKGCGQVAQGESTGTVGIRKIQVQTSKKDSEPFFLKIYKDADLTQFIAEVAGGAIFAADDVIAG